MKLDQKRGVDDWADWFWGEFFPNWLARVQDGTDSVFDVLDKDGGPEFETGKSLLAQARMLFTVSHVGLLTDDPGLAVAADQIAGFMAHFERGGGLYCNRVDRSGNPTGQAADRVARSYDLSFVILGLVTWNKLSPSNSTAALIDACWTALMGDLRDPKTGLLRNDDTGQISNPAQNPHMHLYEACLQAYQMTNDDIWLDRAADMRTTGITHFMDEGTGSLAEFITPDLHPLAGADGLRREVGHQCEWAWLLLEEARLANRHAVEKVAQRLFTFADAFGFIQGGPLQGAVVDAVSAQGCVVEDSLLLWPQTEAIKILAVRHGAGDAQSGERACALMCTMFDNWFADRPVYVNQLDGQGETIWPQALTRLMYHVVLAMIEGAKAGLWRGPLVQIPNKPA